MLASIFQDIELAFFFLNIDMDDNFISSSMEFQIEGPWNLILNLP